MVNTEALVNLFEGNRLQYLSELGIPEVTFYRIIKIGRASLETLCKIAGYFNEPIANLIIVPEEYYR